MTIRNLFLNLDVILLAKLRIIFYFANFFRYIFIKKLPSHDYFAQWQHYSELF